MKMTVDQAITVALEETSKQDYREIDPIVTDLANNYNVTTAYSIAAMLYRVGIAEGLLRAKEEANHERQDQAII